jgi:RNA polymerase-binding protein DksA
MPTKTSDSPTKPRSKSVRGKSISAPNTNANNAVSDLGATGNETVSDATIDSLTNAPKAAKKAGATPSAAAKPAGKKQDAARLNAEQLDHFGTLLVSERARLEEEREQIRSRSGAVDGALPEGDEGGDEDTADLASAMMDKEMDLSVEDEIEDLLAAVDHALQKIEDGTYGICDMSGEAIPTSRLELIPWAALTVECQTLAEGQ